MKPYVAFLVLVGTPAAQLYAQDTFRCGNALIDVGISAEDLVTECGQPDAKELIEEPVRARNAGGGSRVIGTTQIERWTYSRGAGQFSVLLHIEAGELKRIEFLEQ